MTAQQTMTDVVTKAMNLTHKAILKASGGRFGGNLLGMVASTLLANELHRRLTFRASAAVGWVRAQLAGGSLAVAGLLATSLALVVLQTVVPDAGWFVQVLLVAAITGAIGLVRFAALRAWVFTAARRAQASVRPHPAR